MAKPKYDYKSEEFLKNIESLASKGLTDKEIALTLGLSPIYFCEKKGKIPVLSESIARARAQVNAAVRAKYLSIGLGKVKVKSVTRRKIELEDGTLEDRDLITETESELPPDKSVLSHWLYHHDEEWYQKEIAGKRLDLTTNGKDVNGTQLIFAATPLSEKDIQEIKEIQNGKPEEDSTDPGLSET